MGLFAGALIARFGSGRVATVTGTATAGLVLGVGFAGSWAVLALAFLVMGAFDATMDAAMNAHGIGVQRRYGRSILQGFHGMWSVGSDDRRGGWRARGGARDPGRGASPGWSVSRWRSRSSRPCRAMLPAASPTSIRPTRRPSSR